MVVATFLATLIVDRGRIEYVYMDATYTYTQVMSAANEAADMVIDELELPDCGARDIVNLVVNSLATLLEAPTASLDKVIRDKYGEDPEEVLGWCNS